MASWFSNALNATSTSITSLKNSLLGSEADGDTEDDTHVCRVLRSYYTEKGRPFPSWLPPDPKAPAPPPVVQPVAGGRYGNLRQGSNASSSPSTSSGLASLWDSNPAPQQQPPQSLRAGPAAGRGRPGPSPSPFAESDNGMYRRSYGAGTAGSGTTPPGTSSGGPVSTADKLRQRLGRGAGGARTTSPGNQAPFAPPPSQKSSGGYSRGGGGGGGGAGDYEDRFAPGGMYDSGGGGGGRPGGDDKPFMAATSPWATNEAEFMGGMGVGGGGGGGARSGLPGGPRRGLPSGPRMR